MFKKLAVLIVVILGLIVVLLFAAPFKSNLDRYLVLIVLDGCRADYLDLAPMPFLEDLKSKGVSYNRAWVGHMINNTPTSHAVIQSGMLPAKNGIIGFFWKEPGSREWIVPSKWDKVLNGAQIEIMARNGAMGFIGQLKDTYSNVLSASVSGHKFYAAETMGGPACDVIAFPSWGIERRLSEEEKQYGAGGSLLGEEKNRAKIMYVKDKAPSEKVLADPNLSNIDVTYGDDETAVRIAQSIIRNQNPRVLLLNLPHLDHMGHFGAGGYPKWRKNIGGYMYRLDRLIGVITEEYKRLGIYDKTVFMITSDHGMATNGRNLIPEVIAGKLGSRDVSSFTRDIQPFIWVYYQNPELLSWRATKVKHLGIKYLRAIYFKHKDKDRYIYLPHPEYLKDLEPQLDQTYRYLLDTHANRVSPEIYVIPYEHTLMRPAMYEEDVNGLHNSPTWKVQHIPLIISGPGVRKGVVSDYPARLVDIAPTVLNLFGVEPENMDGVILADALENSSESLIERLQEAKRKFAPMVESLRRIAMQDLRLIYGSKYKNPTEIP